MDELTLVIGNRNSSSWSLRPWLLLQHLGLPHRVVTIPLRQPDTAARIRRHSPSGRVPVLRVGELAVWDSLAIAEWLAERHPELWPADPALRALARSAACEMHSGFAALRTFMPMDFTARFGPPGQMLAAVEADVERIVAIWAACRRAAGGAGPFLFGGFGIADAMFAPVCSRFTTYAPPLERAAQAYVDQVMAMPAMQEWGRLAHAEVAGLPPPTEEPERIVAPPPAPPPAPEPAPPPAAVTAAPPPPPAPVVVHPPVAAAPRPVEPREPVPVQRVPVFAPPELREVRLPEPVPPAPQPVAPAPRPPEPRLPEPRPVPPPVPPGMASPPEPPAELRRIPRPIPSTVMVKPIGDGTRRRR